jgi:hypothetical protein
MGADLILTFLPSADTRKKGRVREFAEFVARLSAKDLKDSSAFSGIKIEKARRMLIKYFDWIEELKSLRDTAIVTPYDDKPSLLVTGGLSWGDYATESSEPISALTEVPLVYEMVEKWAMEDLAERRSRRDGHQM